MVDGDEAQPRLSDGELNAFRFVAPQDTGPILRPYVEARLKRALIAADTDATAYLHDGR